MMKRFTNQSHGSQAGRMYNGGAIIRRFALFPLMLLMLLLLPAGMVAQKAASSSKYIATYESSTQTLNFKENVGETLPENSAWVEDKMTVDAINKRLGNGTIVHIVFDKSFSTYTPTSLYKFFANLTKLKTITGLEYLNTEKVTNMSYMFFNCSSLTSLDVTHFNTAKVKNMRNMFSVCSSLTSLYLTNFNTEKVTNMSSMFLACQALTTIYASSKFVTTQVSNSIDMFYNCRKLKGEEVCTNDKATDKTYAKIEGGYFSRAIPRVKYADGTLTFFLASKETLGENEYGIYGGLGTPDWVWQNPNVTNVTKVVFDPAFANARPTKCNEWFQNYVNLTSIEGIEYLNTSQVTDMHNMFYNCYHLQTTDFSGFDTRKVKDMSNMFYNCGSLKSLDISNFNTSEVTDMRGMFEDCQELSSLDLSKFNTKEVKHMNSMFESCSALSSLDLSNFNTANVESMSGMFAGCQKLSSLDLSKFNTANVKNMEDMFKECRKLSLLDLSNFNTERVKDMSSMFSGCSTLQTIFASDKFVTDQVFYGVGMFFDCKNLKGFIDYISNSDKDNYEYANYKTGYFTKLVGKNGDEKIGATGETLATDNLVLDDDKDFVAYEPFAAKAASYSRKIKEGSTWGTLCLPFAIVQSQETECKFYRLTGIDNDNECITLESCEGAEIPAGTPVLFKMNEGEQTLSISAQDASIVTEPKAGTNTDVNLVGSFTKIGGKDNQGLAEYDYIIGKNKFWRVSDLDDGNGVGIKPMRAYIHPANEYLARAAMLSIGKGDGTTAIDNLNAISNDANAEYYDANGRRTNGLQKGLNIVKRGSKTYKIMVK